MSYYYQTCAIPKPEPRKKSKKRERAQHADRVAKIRAYVFGRERGLCRCCMLRRAESMHELEFRSVGGVVSKRNSIAVCGQLVGSEPSCHTYLQNHQIAWSHDGRGAEGALLFVPKTQAAADWMHMLPLRALESKPGSQRSDE